MDPFNIHSAIQQKLLESLPYAQKEYRFPSISRIADIVDFSKKTIFEVQCSSISYEEVRERNHDYQSLGFTVIWILHDKVFNKRNVSLAELYIRQKLSYYTSMTPFGQGLFYDTLDFFKGTERVYQSPPCVIKILTLIPLPNSPSFSPESSSLALYIAQETLSTPFSKKTKENGGIPLKKLSLGGGPLRKGRRSFSTPFFLPMHLLRILI